MNLKKTEPEEIPGLARKIALNIAQETMPIIIKAFSDVHVDKFEAFQAHVFHLYSAYVLSHTIKLLNFGNIPEQLIEEVCQGTIGMAYEMAKEAKYNKIGEH
jgi:hypothetical protein